jgi:hypothetical protein
MIAPQWAGALGGTEIGFVFVVDRGGFQQLLRVYSPIFARCSVRRFQPLPVAG